MPEPNARLWRRTRAGKLPTRRAGWRALLVLAGIAVPIPAAAASGLAIPLPRQVERLAAALIAHTSPIDAPTHHTRSEVRAGSIEFTPEEARTRPHTAESQVRSSAGQGKAGASAPGKKGSNKRKKAVRVKPKQESPAPVEIEGGAMPQPAPPAAPPPEHASPAAPPSPEKETVVPNEKADKVTKANKNATKDNSKGGNGNSDTGEDKDKDKKNDIDPASVDPPDPGGSPTGEETAKPPKSKEGKSK